MMSRKWSLRNESLSSLPFEPLLNIIALINHQIKQLMDVAETRNTCILFAPSCKRFAVAVFQQFPKCIDLAFPEREGFYKSWQHKRSMFLLSQSTADWMLLDMQYRQACDMYKSSRDADPSGRKLSEVGIGLAAENCSVAADWDTKRCSNKRCTRLNNMRTSRGHVKALCEHGFINDVFDQKRALQDCPESCPE